VEAKAALKAAKDKKDKKAKKAAENLISKIEKDLPRM